MKAQSTAAKPTTPTLLQTAAGRWTLNRYPLRAHDQLQAWDAADELLHDIISCRNDQNPLLMNDQWGALLMPFAAATVASQSDSYVSHCAWSANLATNHLEANLTKLSPQQNLPKDIDVVYLKIPKSLSLLEYQLARIAAELPPGTPVFAAAKSKLLTPSVRTLLERYCEQVDISLITKKCRTIRATTRSATWVEADFNSTFIVPEFNLTLHHHAGVFARNQLDVGARFLLEHLPATGAEQVIDLGCGNGVLGLVYAKQSPASHVTWLDESFLAIASTQRNIETNLPDTTNQGYLCMVDDCMSQQA